MAVWAKFDAAGPYTQHPRPAVPQLGADIMAHRAVAPSRPSVASRAPVWVADMWTPNHCGSSHAWADSVAALCNKLRRMRLGFPSSAEPWRDPHAGASPSPTCRP